MTNLINQKKQFLAVIICFIATFTSIGQPKNLPLGVTHHFAVVGLPPHLQITTTSALVGCFHQQAYTLPSRPVSPKKNLFNSKNLHNLALQNPITD